MAQSDAWPSLSLPIVTPEEQPGVFAAKLGVPAPGEGVVVPVRLLEHFDEAIRAGVVVVSAAAGTGKTELAVQWAIQRHRTRDIAWLTLDDSDRAPERFVQHAIAAIRSTRGGQATDELSSLPRSSTLADTYLAAVEAALSHLRHDVVLVLDDFHLLVGSESQRLLKTALRHLPDRVHVVVLSRLDPELGQTDLQLRGRARQIGGSDLALTIEETRAVIVAGGVTAGDALLESIQTKSRGWVTGLRFVISHLAASGDDRSPDHAVRAAVDGAGDYLEDEVLETVTPDMRQFLLHTTVVDVVCADLARALTHRVDAGDVLANANRANLFLDRLRSGHDERCRAYRWHPMFAAALRHRLRATDPSLEAQLHRTAAHWLDANGYPLEAVRHALAGHDVDGAVASVGRSWLDLLVNGAYPDLRAILELFDSRQLASNPELAVACGALRAHDGHVDLALRCARHALFLAPDLPLGRRLAVEAMATVVRLQQATMMGLDPTGEVVDEAHARLRGLDARGRFLRRTGRRQRTLLLYHLGALLVATWRGEEATVHLNEAHVEAEQLDMADLVRCCRAQLAAADLLAGRLESSCAHAAAVIDSTADANGHRREVAIAHLALGGVALLRYEVDGALDHLARAAAAVLPRDRATRFRIMFLRQLALRTAGQVAEARDEVGRLEQLLEGWDAPRWIGAMASLARADCLRLQRPDEAVDLISSGPPPGCEPPLRHLWALVEGWLLLESGRLGDARQVLALVAGADAPSPMRAAALVLDGRAADLAGMHDDALDDIDAALAVAAAERLVLPFVLAGSSIRELLGRLLERGTAHERAALAILDRLAGEHERGGRGIAWPTVVPLTAREIEVLRLLQSTARNEEIAAQLYISLNTLRTHMKHINQKLGTANRRDAARRARELGII